MFLSECISSQLTFLRLHGLTHHFQDFFFFAASQPQHYQEDLAHPTYLGKDGRIPDPEILNHHFRIIIFGDHK